MLNPNSTQPSRTLDPVPNPHPDRIYEVEIECPEFTALCPVTGQPDFATITFKYVPGPYICELKSLKLYMWSFRDEGHFHEDVTNRMLKDFVSMIKPRKLQVVGKFNVRGGIYTTVRAEYEEGQQ
jgi:7-cyano-7-deazaguanine reductase